MSDRIIQLFEQNLNQVQTCCPWWVRDRILNREAEGFALCDDQRGTAAENAEGMFAVCPEEDHLELLHFYVKDAGKAEQFGDRLLRRLKQYAVEHEVDQIFCEEMLPDQEMKIWKERLEAQGFLIRDEAEPFLRISLERVGKSKLLTENPAVAEAANHGNICSALGLEGTRRESLLDLMLQAHPDKKEFSSRGKAFFDLSGVYCKEDTVLAYVFVTIYKGCLIVEECGAKAGMEPLILALLNHFVPQIQEELPGVKEFFIPVNGEFMQIANCRHYMEQEQDLNKGTYWLGQAFWDARQEQIGKDLEELIQISQQMDLDADDGIEIARQGQLINLLRGLQVETCEVWHQGEQAVQIWLSDYGMEVSAYLIYHLVDADTGHFIIETIVETAVCRDKETAAAVCMLFNQERHRFTACLLNERLCLRCFTEEVETPVEEATVRYLLDALQQEYLELMQVNAGDWTWEDKD